MTHCDPFQPDTFCDSVSASEAEEKKQLALKIRHFNKCFPLLDKESLSVLISGVNKEVFCALNELKLMWSELFEMYTCMHECDKNNQIEHINA